MEKQKMYQWRKTKIIYVTAEEEELNYNFCQKYYGKKGYLVVIMNEKQRFDVDSNSNVVELTDSDDFFNIIEQAVLNEETVVVAIDMKISEEELINYERRLLDIGVNIAVFSDREVEKIEFETVD